MGFVDLILNIDVWNKGESLINIFIVYKNMNIDMNS